MNLKTRLMAGAFALPLLFCSPLAHAQSVDVVFVIDESNSMVEEQNFIKNLFVPQIDSALNKKNFAQNNRRYGLIGFGSEDSDGNTGIIRNLFSDNLNSLYGTAQDYSTVTNNNLVSNGDIEPGFDALARAINEYFPGQRVEGTPHRLIVLLTDEEADIGVGPQNPQEMQDLLNQNDVTLVAFVAQTLISSATSPPTPSSALLGVSGNNNQTTDVAIDLNTGDLALDSDGNVALFVSSGQPGFGQAFSTTTADYAETALATPNGCVADLTRVSTFSNSSNFDEALKSISRSIVDCSVLAIAEAELALPSVPPVVVPATVTRGALRTRSFIIYGSREQIRLLIRRSHDLLRGHRTVVSAFAPDPETLDMSTASRSGGPADPVQNSPIQFSFSADADSPENIAESGLQAIFAALQEGASDKPLRVEIGAMSAFALFEASDATYDLDQRFDSYDSTGGIALMGIDYELQPGVTVGGAAAYQVFELESHKRKDEVDVDGYSLSLFGDTMIAPDTMLGGILSYTRSQFDTTRETDDDGLAFSETKGYAVSASATLSHEISQGSYLITPSLSLAAIHTSFDDFNEYGDDPNKYYGDDETIFSAEPKLQVSRNIIDEEWVFTPSAGIGAVIVQEGDEGTVRSISRDGFIANPELAPTEKLSGLVSLGLDGSRADYGASFNIGYSGEFGSNITRHSIIAGAKLRF